MGYKKCDNCGSTTLNYKQQEDWISIRADDGRVKLFKAKGSEKSPLNKRSGIDDSLDFCCINCLMQYLEIPLSASCSSTTAKLISQIGLLAPVVPMPDGSKSLCELAVEKIKNLEAEVKRLAPEHAGKPASTCTLTAPAGYFLLEDGAEIKKGDQVRIEGEDTSWCTAMGSIGHLSGRAGYFGYRWFACRPITKPPEPEFREFTLDEVPVGAQARSKYKHEKSDFSRHLVTSVGYVSGTIYIDGCAEGFPPVRALAYLELSTDNGKTWGPFGKEVL